MMQILLANPRGFCAGVDRAIDIVERAVTLFGAPIYVRHEVVHNKYVVDRLRTIGAVFVEELTEVPDNATVIFSAHGVPRAVQQEAKRRSLNVFDATCPLVTKVHMEITRYAREAREVFLIGHAGHPEVEGTIGQFDASLGGSIYLVQTVEDVAALKVRNPQHVAFVTQTTLSVDDTASIVAALRARFPGLKAPVKEDICYATQNRQDAVKDLIGRCEALVVVGSKSSSNSNRLREMADKNRQARLPGRWTRGSASRVVRGCQNGRCDGRRLGARDFGAGRDCPPARVGRGSGGRTGRPQRTRDIRAAEGAARRRKAQYQSYVR